MIRTRSLLWLMPLLFGACPDPEPGGGSGTSSGSSSTGGGSTEIADSGSTAAADDETAGGSGPMGPCPLVGMFETCTGDGMDGVTYCDEIDGEQQWGPCVGNPACELGESLEGCQECALIEGIPTIEGSPTCACEGVDAPDCEQTECVQRWDYSCDDCQSFTAGTCFSYSEGCGNPWLGCSFESPCSRVWARPESDDSVLAVLEDEAAAVCVLTSLRDGVPGTYDILWGIMFDGGWVTEKIHTTGDGTVIAEWLFDCPGCVNFGHVGRSGRLSLQDPSYFDDCLADPTPDDLIQCLVGFLDYDVSSPPPDGYVPPFTTGDCVSLDVACP